MSLLSISLRTSGRADADLRDHALGVVGFDADAEIADRCADAAVLPFPLLASSLRASGPVCEVWRASGSVERGRHGAIRYTRSEAFLWGRLVLDETEFADDMANVAQAAYACMRDFVAECGYPHLLRVWNYFGAITQGEGDDERYKQFCVGRARSFLPSAEGFPAATAIGFPAPRQRFHLLWLAGKRPGMPIENPRQISAYHYPPQYGPQSPGFARATLLCDHGAPMLLISGTAAVVGHASCHQGDLQAQLDETARNLETLLETARVTAPGLPPRFGAGSLFRVYLRDPTMRAVVEQFLSARWPEVQWTLLHAEVCRSELLVEMDGVHGVELAQGSGQPMSSGR